MRFLLFFLLFATASYACCYMEMDQFARWIVIHDQQAGLFVGPLKRYIRSVPSVCGLTDVETLTNTSVDFAYRLATQVRLMQFEGPSRCSSAVINTVVWHSMQFVIASYLQRNCSAPTRDESDWGGYVQAQQTMQRWVDGDFVDSPFKCAPHYDMSDTRTSGSSGSGPVVDAIVFGAVLISCMIFLKK